LRRGIVTASHITVEQLRRSIAVAKKDLRVYYSKGPVVIFGILMPTFLFLAFSIGREISIHSLLPGMLAVTVFFTASAVSPVIAPWETQGRTLERLASCPIAVWTILLGDALASFIFGVALSAIPIAVGLVAGVSLAHPLILALGIVLAAFCFSSLALIFSSPATSSAATIMMLSSLVKFPLVFISGIFIPLDGLPAWGKGIASVSPLTYFADLARYCVWGTSHYPASVNLLILLAFTVAFFITAVKLHERSLPRRLSS
jgi:ABC-2 type transport system permease protein